MQGAEVLDPGMNHSRVPICMFVCVCVNLLFGFVAYIIL